MTGSLSRPLWLSLTVAGLSRSSALALPGASSNSTLKRLRYCAPATHLCRRASVRAPRSTPSPKRLTDARAVPRGGCRRRPCARLVPPPHVLYDGEIPPILPLLTAGFNVPGDGRSRSARRCHEARLGHVRRPRATLCNLIVRAFFARGMPPPNASCRTPAAGHPKRLPPALVHACRGLAALLRVTFTLGVSPLALWPAPSHKAAPRPPGTLSALL